MKKFFSLFLVMILILNFVSFSYADAANTIDRLIDVDPDAVISAPEPSTPPKTDDEEPPAADEGAKPRWGIFEPIISLIEDILAFLPSMVLRIIYLIPTLDGIIFNTNRLFSITLFDTVVPADTSDAADAAGTASTDDAVGTATGTIKSGSVSAYLQSSISAVYNAFRYLVTAVYIVVLVYLAIRMMLSSVGRQKAKYKELFKYWLIGLLLLFSFHWVMAGVIWLSNTIVEILYRTTISMMSSTTVWEEVSKVSHFSATHYNQSPITDYIFYEITHFLGTVAEIGLVASVFGWALVFAVPILALVFAIMLIKSAFNIIITYFKRLFTILVLVLLFPIVVLSYVFDKIGDRKAQTLSIWIKEFVTNVMIQPIHALILTFIGIMFAKASSSLLLNNAFFGPIFCLLALRLIPMGEELLKKLFQISSQMGPGSHGIAGSVAQAGLALRGMREVTGSLKNNFSKARKLRELRQAETGLDSAFKTAAKGASLRNRAGGNWGIKGAVSALNDRKNSEAYKKYKKAIEKETGSKSLLGATAKAYAPAVGVVGGIGSAITGAGSGQFLSKAATNAAVEGALMGALANAPGSISKFMHGDATKSEDFAKRAKGFENMNPTDAKALLKAENKEERKKIAIELGISEGRVNHLLSSPEGRLQLANAYKQVGNAMRWGVDKEEAKKYSTLYREQADFDKRKREAGGLHAVMDSITGPLTIRNDGTYGTTANGTFLKVDNYGDSSLKDGESRIIGSSSQKGKSVQNAIQENLKSNEDYMELLAQVPVNSSGIRISRDEARRDARIKHGAMENAEKAYYKEKDKDTPDAAKLQALKVAYETASAEYDKAEDIATAVSKMEPMEKQERRRLLHYDEHFANIGFTPTYTETAIHSPERTEIQHNGEERIFAVPTPQGDTQEYVIATSTDTVQRRQIIADAQANGNTIRENNTQVAYTAPTAASRDEVREFIVTQNTPPSVSALESTYTAMANGAPAPANLVQMETQANTDITAAINNFTADPASVRSANGGTEEISSAFADNNIAQESIGEPTLTASTISAVNTNNVSDTISSVLINQLHDVLEKFEGREIYIKVSRPVDTTLHYELYLKVSRNSFANGDVAIPSDLEINEIVNGPITIIYRDGSWFMQ